MKFIKIAAFNILILILFFCILELFCINLYRLEYNREHHTAFKFKEFLHEEKKQYEQLFHEKYYNPQKHFRRPELRRKNDCAIVLLGCSYTYGLFLKYNETFSHLLSEQSCCKVFNFGMTGAGPAEMLYILRKYPSNIKINADYVIYTYISDQNKRMYAKHWDARPAFRKIKKNGGETLKYSKILSIIENSSRLNFFIRRFISENIDKKKSYKLLHLYMKEINKEIKKKFSSETQMILLIYNDEDDYFNNSNKAVEKFKNEGIKIIKLSDILDVDINSLEYKHSKEDFHPNSRAWQVIVPALIKELNLK